MSANDVFNKMKSYHQVTGKVMTGGRFILEVINKFDKNSVIKGLMLFDKYLDEQRKDAS